jgi:hypothetical protein
MKVLSLKDCTDLQKVQPTCLLACLFVCLLVFWRKYTSCCLLLLLLLLTIKAFKPLLCKEWVQQNGFWVFFGQVGPMVFCPIHRFSLSSKTTEPNQLGPTGPMVSLTGSGSNKTADHAASHLVPWNQTKNFPKTQNWPTWLA